MSTLCVQVKPVPEGDGGSGSYDLSVEMEGDNTFNTDSNGEGECSNIIGKTCSALIKGVQQIIPNESTVGMLIHKVARIVCMKLSILIIIIMYYVAIQRSIPDL